MRCDHARRLFSGHLDGILGSDETRRLEEHLADCPACREELESWKAAGAALASVLDTDALSRKPLDAFVEACKRTTEPQGWYARLVEWVAAPRRVVASTVAGGLALSMAIVLLAWFTSMGTIEAGKPAAYLTPHLQYALAQVDENALIGGYENGP